MPKEGECVCVLAGKPEEEEVPQSSRMGAGLSLQTDVGVL